MRCFHFKHKIKRNRKKRRLKQMIYIVLAFALLIASFGAIFQDKKFKQYAEVQYIVKSGDTLWTLAEKYYNGDPRDWVYAVRNLNNNSADIYTGEIIKILIKGDF